jgi:hypothetical protein
MLIGRCPGVPQLAGGVSVWGAGLNIGPHRREGVVEFSKFKISLGGGRAVGRAGCE